MPFVTLCLLSGVSVQMEIDSNTRVSDLQVALSGHCELGTFDEFRFYVVASELDHDEAVARQVHDGGNVQVVLTPSVGKALAFLEDLVLTNLQQLSLAGRFDVEKTLSAIIVIANSAQTDHPDSIRTLGKLLTQDCPITSMKSEALKALGHMGGDHAVTLLFELQQHAESNGCSKSDIYQTLGKIGERIEETRERIVPFCVAHLQGKMDKKLPLQAISAMRALRAMGAKDSKSQAVLEKYLEVDCPLQRRVAQQTLVKMDALPASQSDASCVAACVTATWPNEAVAAAPEEETTTQHMDEAIQSSEQSAAELEQAHLHDALLRSKADARNADGVVIVRLTFHSPQIKDHLMSSCRLQPLFSRLRDAGCEASPEWAGGALFLVPMTHGQANEAEIHLKPHNIILLPEDIELLKDVLKEIPKRVRHGAEVKPEHCADQIPDQVAEQNSALAVAQAAPSASAESHADSESHKKSSCTADAEVALVIERTFLTFPLRSLELSESSTVVQSAPAGTADGNAHSNPRRWSSK